VASRTKAMATLLAKRRSVRLTAMGWRPPQGLGRATKLVEAKRGERDGGASPRSKRETKEEREANVQPATGATRLDTRCSGSHNRIDLWH